MFRFQLVGSILLLSLLFLFAESGIFAQDPAVTSLGVTITKRTSDMRTQIEIVGIVQNIGTKDFKSGAGQQAVRLYRQRSGAKGEVVLERTFTTLKAGESVTYRYTTDWDVRRPSNPDFILQIDLDPDIYSDGNPNNDDVDQKNNRRTLSARTIDERVGRKTPNK